MAVTKASTETRRLAIAQAFQATVEVVDDQKKVTASFISNRVSGPGGSVVIGKEGSLRMAEVDGRVVLKLNMFATKQTKQDSVQDFAVMVLGIPVHITWRQFDAGHCYLRCPQTQVSKLLAKETSRKFISDDGDIEIEVSSASGEGKPHFMSQGSWLDAGSRPGDKAGTVDGKPSKKRVATS